MSSVSNKTASIVENFIRHNVDDNNKLCLSVQTIGDLCGKSNATIWRALKNLEASGLIDIIPPVNAYSPQTIIYHGPKAIDLVKNQVNEALLKLEDVKSIVAEIMRSLNEVALEVRSMEGAPEGKTSASSVSPAKSEKIG